MSDLHSNIYSPGSSNSVLKEIEDEISKGKLHILYSTYQKHYGYNSNIVIPYFDIENKCKTDLIIVNNPKDAERLASTHVKKTPYLKKNLYDSIISTTSVEHWKDQRNSYSEAFSVNEKLKDLIPISNRRAMYCVKILADFLDTNKDDTIDIYDFFLNETLAQLHLAMFGFSNDFQENTNKKIRETFKGKNDSYARKYAFDLLKEVKKSNGPLSEVMCKRESKFKTKKEEYGNAMTFTFAGHDTTANTLTWLIFEICRHPQHYSKLQTEIDTFWSEKTSNDILYTDFKKLPFMTRCIMEILRLWTPIPNGTSRELQKDDYVIGKNNVNVEVKKGTYIQIPNWTRHRNPLLWGSDVNVFNPEREFKGDEIWDDMVFATYNPYSERFSPFAYGPRDCIGKNFSQIEMRIILLHLLKNFTFSIGENDYNIPDEELSFNAATLGPRSINNVDLYDNTLGLFVYACHRNKNTSKL